MYIALTFGLLLLAIMLAWFGKRERSVLVFIISFMAAIVIFYHHMDTVIGLSL